MHVHTTFGAVLKAGYTWPQMTQRFASANLIPTSSQFIRRAKLLQIIIMLVVVRQMCSNVRCQRTKVYIYRGTSLIRKRPPP